VVVDNLDVYLTEDFTSKAIDFITVNRGVPFFLYLSYTAPHRPLQVTEKYLDRFSDEPDLSRRIYKAMIAAMDDGIGEVLDTLDILDLARDTMVIFTSDNGCVFVESCNPGTLLSHPGVELYGGKFSYFEGGIRVPFMMKWPRALPNGQVYDRYVSGLDIVPTVIAATQGILPKDRRYDGTDLMPYVTGASIGNPHDFLFWKTDHHRAVRRGPWKLYEALEPNPENYLSPPAVFPPPFTLLFDVEADPGEFVNQAVLEPAKVELLRRSISVFEARASKPAWPARKLKETPMEVEGNTLYVPY
jgi:arylsulfatase A-like enzyme